MNEQQLAAVKQALEALTVLLDEWTPARQAQLKGMEAVTALQSIISQDALYKMAEDAVTIGLSYNDWDKIGCVNHDCDKCKAVGEIKTEVKEDGNGSFTITDAHSTADVVRWLLTQDTKETILCLIDEESQPASVQDAEGENKAVRSFLMLYGQPGLTVGQMKKHMTMSGFKMWPAWVDTEPDEAHLTKAGAQLWIRHLFALEPPAPQPVPVKTYHDGKPWPVAPKPWVGLTDEERNECTQSPFTADQHRAIEAKLKEKNHDH
jgi:hypothetical protein